MPHPLFPLRLPTTPSSPASTNLSLLDFFFLSSIYQSSLEMADCIGDLSTDPPIVEKASEIKSTEIKVSDSVSTEWTDEKHSLYLNSMEASFVNQLYSSEYLSKDFLGWVSRTKKHKSSSGSSANSMPREFKVQRWGCWKKIKFERAKRRDDIENQSRLLSTNPWIQHFRSSASGNEPDITSLKKKKELNITSSYQVDNKIQSNHLTSPRHGREGTSSKQLPTCFSHLCCQDSFGSNTEVSDQNFVDKEFERGEQSSRLQYKKRARTSIDTSPVKDQLIVPHITDFQDAAGENQQVPNLEPKSAFSKDQEVNSVGLDAE